MIKNILINLLKLAAAGGLITWLVKSGKLELSFIEEVFQTDPLRIFFAIGFILLDQSFVALRLKIIILTKAKEAISIFKLLIINWIGLFFNSVLPGAVTGDLVKIFYIRDMDRSLPKDFIFLGVFMDRVIGLIGLITVGTFFSLFNYNTLTTLSENVKHLVHINMLLFLVILIAAFFFLFFHQVPLKISAKLKNYPLLNSIMPIFDRVWETFILFKSRIWELFLCSLAVQFFAILIFWYLVHPYAEGGELDLAIMAAVLPMGFISIAIPIAPAGLGVGHAVFESLFAFFNITNGANLFNLYFIVMMITNLTGAIPYVLYRSKNKVDLQKIKEEQNL